MEAINPSMPLTNQQTKQPNKKLTKGGVLRNAKRHPLLDKTFLRTKRTEWFGKGTDDRLCYTTCKNSVRTSKRIPHVAELLIMKASGTFISRQALKS
jgi:hypothetical protein